MTVPGIDSKKSPKSSNAKSENNDRRCRAFGDAERIDSIAETMTSRFSTARADRRFRNDQLFHQGIVVASAPPVGAVVVSSDSDSSELSDDSDSDESASSLKKSHGVFTRESAHDSVVVREAALDRWLLACFLAEATCEGAVLSRLSGQENKLV